MKTYLRNYELTFKDVLNAYYKWTKSRSGHKNGNIVNENYGNGHNLCVDIYRQIKDRSLSFIPIRYYERTEPNNGKVRLIGVQSIKQQVCDYLIVHMLQDMLNAKLGYYQCASVPNKGQVFAMKHLSKWYDEGGYFVKLDVRKCYPSIDQSVLLNFLKKHIGCEDLLYVCESILATYEGGLNIGSYFSQYMANLVLSIAYHHVETLYKVRRGVRKNLVTHQLWYMDDCIMFSKSKHDLAIAAKDVERFMRDFLHLELKPWKICKCGFDDLDMVGYVMRSNTVRLRKSTWRRARRAFSRYSRAPCLRRAFRLISYWGFLKWTDGAFNTNNSKLFIEARKMISVRSVQCITRA